MVDRALIFMGCDEAFISDLLGDLREEYTHRAVSEGDLTARFWYTREILRSAPHLAWSVVRYGNAASRIRLGGALLTAIATLSLATVAWLAHKGPPARLVSEAASADGVVVNHTGPVRLSMTVLDASGHELEGRDIRYARLSGIPIQISDRGVARCTQRGDAVVRATLDALNTDFVVHCQPVAEVRSAGWGNFLVGDSARTLTVDAIGIDGEPVTLIAARIRVADSTVATLDGSALRPLRAGMTEIELEIGNQTVGANVTVFEPLRSLAEMKPDQRWVAVPVRLQRGESVRWPLPTGLFFLAFSDDTTTVPTTRGWGLSGSAHPSVTLSVDGPIMCMPEPRVGVSDTHCLVRGAGATLTITRTAGGASDVVGMLALERQEQR
jgi:hypothetical protein